LTPLWHSLPSWARNHLLVFQAQMQMFHPHYINKHVNITDLIIVQNIVFIRRINIYKCESGKTDTLKIHIC
jgi:hypothetical protein